VAGGHYIQHGSYRQCRGPPFDTEIALASSCLLTTSCMRVTSRYHVSHRHAGALHHLNIPDVRLLLYTNSLPHRRRWTKEDERRRRSHALVASIILQPQAGGRERVNSLLVGNGCAVSRHVSTRAAHADRGWPSSVLLGAIELPICAFEDVEGRYVDVPSENGWAQSESHVVRQRSGRVRLELNPFAVPIV